ncbi:MAG: hypothetical protein JWQ09_1019 [Segetibacter sp.]|nr:hypothetical protein [Segetibacter sp.]
MTKTIFFLLTLFLSATLFAQPFEGKIIYKNTIKSKLPSVTDQQFSSMLGDTQEYFIKGGAYKSVTNGSLIQWQLYVNDDNKLYNKMSNAETLTWNNGAVNQDEVLKAEIIKEAADVLGYKCDELILTCKSGIQKYYFSSKFPVDVKLYEKHKYGNWYEVVSRTGSLPLKSIIDNPQFTLESMAIEVKPMQLNKSLFVLPANVKTTKSPY